MAISRMNPIAMSDMVGGHAGTVIKKSGEEIDRLESDADRRANVVSVIKGMVLENP